jgi:SAM-dependent methyltransferase
MWDGGDYAALADRLSPAAHALALAVPEPSTRPVLDIAAGTGSVAVALARQGHSVVATDLAPGLVDQGRRRTAQLGLDVEWHVLAMDDLDPLGRTFAAVTSSFGLIFAPEPVSVLRRIRQVLGPDGTVLLTVWHPEGYIASMSRAMTAMLPSAAGEAVTAWIRWGDEQRLSGWFGAAGLGPAVVEHRSLPWRFQSAQSATDFLFASSPGHVAAARTVGDRAPALRTLVRDHLVEMAGVTDPDDDPIDLALPYLLVRASRD